MMRTRKPSETLEPLTFIFLRALMNRATRLIDWLNGKVGEEGKPKQKHTGEQMLPLSALFDGYDDDVSIWDFYAKQDIKPDHQISDLWNGEAFSWKGERMHRKPDRAHIDVRDLMLSDFEKAEEKRVYPNHVAPWLYRDLPGDGRIGKR